MESDMEKFLNRLIITYITQNIGRHALAEESDAAPSPASFLNRLAWGARKDYIKGTLNAYLFNELPDGDIYVFTPIDGLKYGKSNNIISYRGTYPLEVNGNTLDRTIDDIKVMIQGAGGKGSVHVLFFDKKAKETFEQKFGGYTLAPESKMLAIEGYEHGGVSLFRYGITQSLPQPGR